MLLLPASAEESPEVLTPDPSRLPRELFARPEVVGVSSSSQWDRHTVGAWAMTFARCSGVW